MKIAFLYVAEPYQCYHVAAVSSALSQLPNVEVTEFVSFPETAQHLDRIRETNQLGGHIVRGTLRVPARASLLRRLRRLDSEREVVMRANVAQLEAFDAVVATEYSAGLLREMGLRRPALILIQHGAGDREVNDEHLIRQFDLSLVSGPKIAEAFLAKKLATAAQTRIIGYPKFDAVNGDRIVRGSESSARPLALYNPHYKKGLSSYRDYLAPLAEAVNRLDRYDLLVAPHVKIFHKDFGRRRRQFEKVVGGRVRLDTASSSMLDMTHTARASLYIGDVSSQVYEFLITPRPCVFLNPHGVAWRNNPHFRHWTLGDVVERPEDIYQALAQAESRHVLYRARQERVIQETFGSQPRRGASFRAAQTIRDFLRGEASPVGAIAAA
ncbi:MULTISPECIES: hypothetical protein [Asaia]|uniref:Glycerophosphotransferase n=1 Tax=Asaia bogorensis TaxID=91915 RepID=A0A060QJI5_9PROT|nr:MULTISPECIES: hypothetical protein [Asaia]ETC99872.1 hypothetical protein P792_01505 [Asaia sp. SF2.1]CDG39406.1 hypothetical protein ASAP_1361 [Asaia bogorensis]